MDFFAHNNPTKIFSVSQWEAISIGVMGNIVKSWEASSRVRLVMMYEGLEGISETIQSEPHRELPFCQKHQDVYFTNWIQLFRREDFW